MTLPRLVRGGEVAAKECSMQIRIDTERDAQPSANEEPMEEANRWETT